MTQPTVPPTVRLAARYLATVTAEVRAAAVRTLCPDLDLDDDPVGRVLTGFALRNGVHVTEVTAPLGVVGLEAPTAELVAACLWAGNAVVARGYQDTDARSALGAAALPVDAVVGAAELPGGDLDAVVAADGTAALAERVGSGHHVYVDKDADAHMATYVVVNAVATGAADSLLFHSGFDRQATDDVLSALKTLDLDPDVWSVGSSYEAIETVDRLSAGTRDAILTDSLGTAREFQRKVDAAAVVLNCSPAFAADETRERQVAGYTRTRWLYEGNGQTRILD